MIRSLQVSGTQTPVSLVTGAGDDGIAQLSALGLGGGNGEDAVQGGAWESFVDGGIEIGEGFDMVAKGVAIVVFDDRIEIRSYGRLPRGVTLAQLSRKHKSELRNPLIAGAFHRTGTVEVWDRGTDRVIDECVRYGIAPPTFEEDQGFITVTFRAPIADVTPQVTLQVTLQVTPQVAQVVRASIEPIGREELQTRLGLTDREHFRKAYLVPALESGLVERTIPDKPQSRLQKYRITEHGRAWLASQFATISAEVEPQ